MSDLAPFVAAAIRDQVVLDLQKENKGLREENDNLKDALSVVMQGDPLNMQEWGKMMVKLCVSECKLCRLNKT